MFRDGLMWADRRLGRYRWPWALFSTTVLMDVLRLDSLATAAALLSVAASILWVVVSATAQPIRPRHHVLVWAPVLPWMVPLLWSLVVVGKGAEGDFVLAMMFLVAPAALTALLCAAGAVTLLVRRHRRPA